MRISPHVYLQEELKELQKIAVSFFVRLLWFGRLFGVLHIKQLGCYPYNSITEVKTKFCLSIVRCLLHNHCKGSQEH